MAELNDILASGSVGDIKQNGIPVVDEESLSQLTLLGLPVPALANDTVAVNGAIFWNLSNGKLQYKSPGGILLQFTMTLV
jgi:hypothetical protein